MAVPPWQDWSCKNQRYGTVARKNVRKNPLASFMSELSKNCKLSMIYTNHSIRVTGCTILTRCNFSYSEIMAVSSCKRIQSLAIYQKTKEKEKIKMAKALFQSMTRSEDEIDINKSKEIKGPISFKALPTPPSTSNQTVVLQTKQATTPKMSVNPNTNMLVPFEPSFEDDDLSDMDILSAICGVQEDLSAKTSVSTMTVSNTSLVNAAPKAMFANCHIGAINITINKK